MALACLSSNGAKVDLSPWRDPIRRAARETATTPARPVVRDDCLAQTALVLVQV
jgi:hypothetical protein